MNSKNIRFFSKLKAPVLGILSAALVPVSNVQAMKINLQDSDFQARWDNTLKYNAAWRLKDAKVDVAGTNYNPNIDAGDTNFDKGLVSNRVDILSEFDLSYKGELGLRISAAGWYDDVYHKNTDSNLELTNIRGVSNSNFSRSAKKLHGGDVELLDAFISYKAKPADMRMNIKVGRFAQLYGESIFFGSNGVADAQATPDLVKALSVPGSQIKEILRPTEQIALNLQVNQQLSFGTYYQFAWNEAQLPAAGSYYSFSDFAGKGANTVYFPTGLLVRDSDISGRDSGQWGVQVKYRTDETEYGFYASRHHAKTPQFYFRPTLGTYSLVYAEDIKIYGISASTLFGETNVAAELSYRPNAPLNAIGNVMIDDGTGNNNSNSLYPVGRTTHLNISTISLLKANSLWDGASFVGEFALNYLNKVTDNSDQLDPRVTRSASAFRFIFQPEYFQVLPGVDLQVPIGVGYGLHGRTAGTAGMPPEHGGDFTIGVKADVNKTFQMSLSYTNYFGKGKGIVDETGGLSYGQVHQDRDFISLTAQRTF